MVVFTELIVILAFLSRFILDRQISDLNDRIKEQVAVIGANSEFEQKFRFTQARLKSTENLINSQSGATNILDKITPLVSADVTVAKLTVVDGTAQLSGISQTTTGLSQTISAFRKSEYVTDVGITNISMGENTSGAIRFTLSARIRLEKIGKERI